MKKTIFINGMHCHSCEILLEQEINAIKGISNAKASYSKGNLNFSCQEEIPQAEILNVINKLGYTINASNNKNSKTAEDYLNLVTVILFSLIISYIFLKIDFFKFLPDISNQTSVLSAFLIGVVASLSTCLALVGGIVLSFSSIYKPKPNITATFLNRAWPHLYFHLGRIISFIILGGILGLIGKKMVYSTTVTAYLSILIGLIMFYMGLQIIGLVPSIASFGLQLPKFMHKKIVQLQNSQNQLMPVLIGALTFFLPCGFTQSMQLSATLSGSFLTGAMILGAFAIGTLPVLISIGIGASYTQKTNFTFLNKVIGVIVLFLALFSINSGLILSGHNTPALNIKKDNIESTTVIDQKNDTQTVVMQVDYTFKPNEFTIKKGVPVRFEIYGVNLTGCNNEIIIPKLNISSGKLKNGLNVVEFTPTETGVLPFSCWMGMIKGKFIVEE